METMFKDTRNKDFVRKNDQIRVPQVLLVKDGQKLGIFKTYEALRMARDEGLDLVEVSPHSRPVVCSIMDYGKHKYDVDKKKKQNKNTGPKEKEVSFRYVIDQNDLNTKINQIKSHLEKGDKVKIVVKFKARENAHKDQGMIAIKKCLTALEGFCTVEKQPSFEGGQIIARVTQKSK